MNVHGARREKDKMNMIGNETVLSGTPRIRFVFPEVRESPQFGCGSGSSLHLSDCRIVVYPHHARRCSMQATPS